MTTTLEPSDTSASSPVIRVIIVSEVRLYREGLAHVLAAQPGVSVSVSSAKEARANLGSFQPHIILAEAAIVRGTDFVAIAAGQSARVVAFAVVEEDEEEILACARAGVAGFVGRDATLGELTSALLVAYHGDLRCSPRVASLIVRDLARLAASQPPRRQNLPITHREREILALIERGLSNKQIATRLNIEVATVKNHVHHLLEKLRVRRRGEAVAAVRASPYPA